MGSRLRFRSRPMRVGFGLMRACTSVRGALSFVGGSSGALDEPFFTGATGQVSHIYEDWDYPTLADTYDQSGTRVDGGRSFVGADSASRKTLVSEGDGFGSVKHVVLDYNAASGIGSTYGSGYIANYFDNAPMANHWLNVSQAEEAVVVEWAVRMRGANHYIGKSQDYWVGGAPNLGRWNYDPQQSTLGSASASCDNNPLCSLYYANDGTTHTALGATLKAPPQSSTWGPNFNLDESTYQPWAPTSRYRQNMNWGSGADEFQWGTAGASIVNTGWYRYKFQITKTKPGVVNPITGTQHGYGRVEMWARKPNGITVKIMEFVGDPGAGRPEEGLVWVGPSHEALIPNGRQLHIYDLSATIHPGDSLVDLGYVRVWSHERVEL